MKNQLVTTCILLLVFIAANQSSGSMFPDYYRQRDTTKIHTFESDSGSNGDHGQDSLNHLIRQPSYSPLNSGSGNAEVINSNTFSLNDYRYSANIIELLPYSFLQNFGSAGQPNESILYGVGNGSISFSINGVEVNNLFYNSLDLHFIQSESYDSLELMPLSSGFLFSSVNNPVHVNFIPRRLLTDRPFSRIRFYQASSEEGFIDVIFNAPLFGKTNLYAEVTNYSAEPRGGKSEGTDTDYNTDFSLWNVTSRLRYDFDETMHIVGSYYHSKENVELNGGVVNNEDMYDNLAATVIYPDRHKRISINEFSLDFNAALLRNANTHVTAYYRDVNDEYWQNSDSSYSNIPKIVSENSHAIYGITARQKLAYSIMEIDVAADYKSINYDSGMSSTNDNENIFALSSDLSFNLLDYVFPSVFAKTLNLNKIQFSGAGADCRFVLGDDFSLFGGISFFEKPFSFVERNLLGKDITIKKQKVNTLEIKGMYSDNYLTGSIGYFYLKNDNYAYGLLRTMPDTIVNNSISEFRTTVLERTGLNLKVDLKLWKILLTNNLNYYISNNTRVMNSLPDYNMIGGVYYIDTLFNSNLFLKAGINFRINGDKSFLAYDFEKSLPAAFVIDEVNGGRNLISNEVIPSSFQLDLFVSGTIQRNAIVYIVFENLLDNKYYLLPYYPMFPQGFRFGVSWEFFD
ncbi:MAG: hypothetical protein JW995_02530 [Melioribacteraceae bacterium]|nr:hypothetical protein [Melioribacteraceae bacterium]